MGYGRVFTGARMDESVRTLQTVVRKIGRRRWFSPHRDPQNMAGSRKRTVSSFVRANRHACFLGLIPAWFDYEKVKLVYIKSTLLGMTVDHIVPLKADLVCGLHVWDNLQLLKKTDNRRKGRLHWPDMPGVA